MSDEAGGPSNIFAKGGGKRERKASTLTRWDFYIAQTETQRKIEKLLDFAALQCGILFLFSYTVLSTCVEKEGSFLALFAYAESGSGVCKTCV